VNEGGNREGWQGFIAAAASASIGRRIEKTGDADLDAKQ